MRLHVFDRTTDYFDQLAGLIPCVTDYFDFPSSMAAFGESLKSSQLAVVDDNQVFFRKLNMNLTLISYYCDSVRLRRYIEALLNIGYKIKSLNYVNKEMTSFLTRKYANEYWVDQSWTVESVIEASKNGRKKRKAIRLCEDMYQPEYEPTQEELMEVFEKWYADAKTRHFMVVRGHYIRYIQRYFIQRNNVKIIGFRNQQGLLVGMIGYEIYRGDGQITLGKHIIGDHYFPFFYETFAVRAMQADGAEKLFFGSEADELKQSLRMNADMSYKLVLK